MNTETIKNAELLNLYVRPLSLENAIEENTCHICRVKFDSIWNYARHMKRHSNTLILATSKDIVRITSFRKKRFQLLEIKYCTTGEKIKIIITNTSMETVTIRHMYITKDDAFHSVDIVPKRLVAGDQMNVYISSKLTSSTENKLLLIFDKLAEHIETYSLLIHKLVPLMGMPEDMADFRIKVNSDISSTEPLLERSNNFRLNRISDSGLPISSANFSPKPLLERPVNCSSNRIAIPYMDSYRSNDITKTIMDTIINENCDGRCDGEAAKTEPSNLLNYERKERKTRDITKYVKRKL